MRWYALLSILVCAGASSGQYGADLFVVGLPRLGVGRVQVVTGTAAPAPAEGSTQVLLDVDGPGLVSRLWCADPTGTLRVLVDGEAEPRLEQPLAELPTLDLWPPQSTVCTRAGGGLLCRMVIGFQLHLRLEVTGAPPLRYEVTWVRLPAGQTPPEFARTRLAPPFGTPERQELMRHQYDDLAKRLRAQGADGVTSLGNALLRDPGIASSSEAKTVTVPASGSTVVYEAAGAGCLRQLTLAPAPDTLAGLRCLRLRATWDGAARPSVDVPLADLLGFALGRRGGDAAPFYRAIGGYVVDWPMPFRRAAKVELVNTGPRAVQVRGSYVAGGPPADGDGYFCATGVAGEPAVGQPFTLLDVTGRGKYVGTVVALTGDAQAAYLDGTVRFAVDGSQTLQALDTSEYFGAADNFRAGACVGAFEGVTQLWPDRSRLAAYRWHGDAEVGFERSLKVTLDHGAANEVGGCRYRTVALWYTAEPATPEPMPADAPPPPFAVKVGRAQVVEAESLTPTLPPGSTAEVKTVDDSELTYQASGGKALAYWLPPGESVHLRLPVPRDGLYRVGWLAAEDSTWGVRIDTGAVPIGSSGARSAAGRVSGRAAEDSTWDVRIDTGALPIGLSGARSAAGQSVIACSSDQAIGVELYRASYGLDPSKLGLIDVPRGTVDCFWLSEVGRVKDAIEAEQIEPRLRGWPGDNPWRNLERSPMVQGAEVPDDAIDSGGGFCHLQAGAQQARPAFTLRVPKAGRYGLALGVRQGPGAGAVRVMVDKQPVGTIDCRAGRAYVGARFGLGTFDFAPLRKVVKGASHRPPGATGPPAGGFHTVVLEPVDDRPVDVDYFLLRQDTGGQEAEFLLPEAATAGSLVTWERSGQEPAWSGGSYVRVEHAQPGRTARFTVRVPRAGRYRVRVTPARLPGGVATKVWLGGQRIGTMACGGAAPGLGRAIARSVTLPAGPVPLALEAGSPGIIALDCIRLDRKSPTWPIWVGLVLLGAVWRRRRVQVAPQVPARD